MGDHGGGGGGALYRAGLEFGFWHGLFLRFSTLTG